MMYKLTFKYPSHMCACVRSPLQCARAGVCVCECECVCGCTPVCSTGYLVQGERACTCIAHSLTHTHTQTRPRAHTHTLYTMHIYRINSYIYVYVYKPPVDSFTWKTLQVSQVSNWNYLYGICDLKNSSQSAKCSVLSAQC